MKFDFNNENFFFNHVKGALCSLGDFNLSFSHSLSPTLSVSLSPSLSISLSVSLPLSLPLSMSLSPTFCLPLSSLCLSLPSQSSSLSLSPPLTLSLFLSLPTLPLSISLFPPPPLSHSMYLAFSLSHPLRVNSRVIRAVGGWEGWRRQGEEGRREEEGNKEPSGQAEVWEQDDTAARRTLTRGGTPGAPPPRTDMWRRAEVTATCWLCSLVGLEEEEGWRRSQQCSWKKSRGGDLPQPREKERCLPPSVTEEAHTSSGERGRAGDGRLMETLRRGRWRTQAVRSSLLLCLLTGEFSVRSVWTAHVHYLPHRHVLLLMWLMQPQGSVCVCGGGGE